MNWRLGSAAQVLAELAQAKRSGEYDRLQSQHKN
jgi:hypothetical protein